ncbi:glycine/betaine ABC transporter substrate-binding protein [Paenibacillus sp. CAA11]|uniref:ABC transporter substrate-binding protein n=1 Tax=Paenibacillus sp. CAA11 TaxID=1532905 RepID=UPI000D3DADAA|nr:glycine betaine ABC transporter substrate-binding protein [Paenibacillus sp. CAA11]AWB44448.1 glycine/betaine ABC transporter substrate-binding protein [Paenibacillus sp. CAA11]
MDLRKTTVCIAVIFSLLCLSSCGKNPSAPGKAGGDLIIGSKNFTENIVLANLMALVIEDKTDIHVKLKTNLGGSNIAWTALRKGSIQIYPEYTGTIVQNYYQSKTGSPEETLSITRKLLNQDKLAFLSPFGFNNSYTLAVQQETAQKFNLQTYSDVAKVAPKLSLSCPFEFVDRPDGYPGLRDAYNLNFRKVKGMDTGIMYRLIAQRDTDVVTAYTTDGQVSINKLKLLVDDRSFFPPYDAGPLVRQDTLNQYPQLAEVLNTLHNQISEKEMQEMNAKVDEGYKAEQIAADFLKQKGLIR